MQLQEIMEMTNEYGKKFLSSYLKNADFLGIEKTESNISRKEFTLITKERGKIYAAILPDKGTNDDGSCFFGDLNHFAMCYAEGKSGIRLHLQNSGKLMWPVWYTEKEDFLRWKKIYDEMMQKYAA